jgi:hypothetical protein
VVVSLAEVGEAAPEEGILAVIARYISSSLLGR